MQEIDVEKKLKVCILVPEPLAGDMWIFGYRD